MSSSRGTLQDTSCGVGLISTGPASVPDGLQHLPRDVPDGPIGGERHALGIPVGVFDDGLVGAQIEGGHDRARAVGCGQRERLPSARGQAQGGVLQLGLRRRQRDRQLAQQLRVSVQRVAGLLPFPVVDGGPAHRHRSSGYRSAEARPGRAGAHSFRPRTICRRNRCFAVGGRPHYSHRRDRSALPRAARDRRRAADDRGVTGDGARGRRRGDPGARGHSAREPSLCEPRLADRAAGGGSQPPDPGRGPRARGSRRSARSRC